MALNCRNEEDMSLCLLKCMNKEDTILWLLKSRDEEDTSLWLLNVEMMRIQAYGFYNVGIYDCGGCVILLLIFETS